MSSGLKFVLSALGILVFFIGVGMCSRPEAPETIPMSDSQKAASARHQGTASKPSEPVRANVEIIDCLAANAPDWCSEIKYATENERSGTLAWVVRSDSPGTIHWCQTIRDKGVRYNAREEGTGYVSSETAAQIGARGVWLMPRGWTELDVRFIVLPVGMPEPKWMSPCPVPD